MENEKVITVKDLTEMIESDVEHALRTWEDYKTKVETYPQAGSIRVFSKLGYITSICIREVQSVAESYMDKNIDGFSISYGVSYDEDVHRAVVEIVILGSSKQV